jgi:hypothetical protein
MYARNCGHLRWLVGVGASTQDILDGSHIPSDGRIKYIQDLIKELSCNATTCIYSPD